MSDDAMKRFANELDQLSENIAGQTLDAASLVRLFLRCAARASEQSSPEEWTEKDFRVHDQAVRAYDALASAESWIVTALASGVQVGGDDVLAEVRRAMKRPEPSAPTTLATRANAEKLANEIPEWRNEPGGISAAGAVDRAMRILASLTPEPHYPTADAYEAASAALWRHRAIAATLAGALENARSHIGANLREGDTEGAATLSSATATLKAYRAEALPDPVREKAEALLVELRTTTGRCQVCGYPGSIAGPPTHSDDCALAALRTALEGRP